MVRRINSYEDQRMGEERADIWEMDCLDPEDIQELATSGQALLVKLSALERSSIEGASKTLSPSGRRPSSPASPTSPPPVPGELDDYSQLRQFLAENGFLVYSAKLIALGIKVPKDLSVRGITEKGSDHMGAVKSRRTGYKHLEI